LNLKNCPGIDAKHKKWLVVLNRRIAIDTEGGWRMNRIISINAEQENGKEW